MPTPVTCAHCGRTVNLPDNWAQPGFKCPHCKQANRLPIPASPPPAPLAPIPSSRGELVPDDDYDDRPRRRRRQDDTQVVEHHSYDHTPKRSAFGTAFGVSTGCLLGILAVMLAVLIGMGVLCAGCFGLIGEGVRRVDERQKQEEQKAVDSAVGVNEWSLADDVQVAVTKVAVEKPLLVVLSMETFRPREQQGTKNELVVWLSVQNVSKTKRHQYHRRAPDGFLFDAPKLTDEHGNKYRQVGPPERGYVKGGQTESVVDLEPGAAAIADAITFEKPVATATSLTLVLPSPTDGGGRNKYVFRIPASAWKK